MYDPTVGRFLQEDPIGITGGDTNFYRYCGNEPLTHVDPLGLCKQLKFLNGNIITVPDSVKLFYFKDGTFMIRYPDGRKEWYTETPTLVETEPPKPPSPAPGLPEPPLPPLPPTGASEAAGALGCIGEALQADKQENFYRYRRDRELKGSAEWKYWDNLYQNCKRMREEAARKRAEEANRNKCPEK